MPTRISAGVGDYRCFLTFYLYDPYYFLFFLTSCLFFLKITIIISWRMPNYILVENPLASTLHIHSFSAHYAVL